MLGPTIGIRRAQPNSHSVLNDLASISPGHVAHVPVSEETSHILWPGGGGSAIKWTPTTGAVDWPTEE